MKLKEKISNLKNDIGVMSKDLKNPFFKSQYFDINQLLENLKPLEEKHKVSFLQPLVNVLGKPAMRLIIIDLESDEKEEYDTVMPENTDPQKMGSTITYFRRYSLVSYLGIRAEDDDGNAGAGKSINSGSKVAPTGKILPS